MATKTVRAMKDYNCEMCNGKIPKGSKYEDVVILPSEDFENGEFNHYRIHLTCEVVFKVLREADIGSAGENCLPEDELEEDLLDLQEKLKTHRLALVKL